MIRLTVSRGDVEYITMDGASPSTPFSCFYGVFVISLFLFFDGCILAGPYVDFFIFRIRFYGRGIYSIFSYYMGII